MKKNDGQKDGFEIVEHDTGKVVHFVECAYDGRMREKTESGLVRKTDSERFYVRDTRSAAG